jgi:hypothetical protein
VSKQNGKIVHRTYHEFAKSVIKTCERSHNNGNPKAWWDIVVFCEQNNWPKPAWVREKLIEHAWKQAKVTGEEKKGGRPHNHALDLYIYREVESCCELGHYYNCEFDGSAKKYKCFGNKPRSLTKKNGRFSKSLAFKMINEDLKELNLESETIKRAYYRGKKLWENLRNSGAFDGPISTKFYGLEENPVVEKNILSLQKQAAGKGFPLSDDVARDLANVFKSDQFASVLSQLKILTPKVSLETAAQRVMSEHFKPVEPIEDNYPAMRVPLPKKQNKSVH